MVQKKSLQIKSIRLKLSIWRLVREWYRLWIEHCWYGICVGKLLIVWWVIFPWLKVFNLFIFFRNLFKSYLFIISVSIACIKEVRVGKTTEALKNRDIAGVYPDECAFSIIFGDNYESMDLIGNTPDEANIWVTGLTCLISANLKSRTCKF